MISVLVNKELQNANISQLISHHNGSLNLKG